MRKQSEASAHRRPQYRLIQRRRQPGRRRPLWDERRFGSGRRKEDNWDAMKAALSRLFWGGGDLQGKTYN